MNKGNGFADANAFVSRAKQYRYKELATPLGKVVIRSLTAGEFCEFRKLIENDGELDAGLWAFGTSALTPDRSKPLFNELDRKELRHIDASVMVEIVAECMMHSMSGEVTTEQAAKNSETTPGESSPTDSHSG